MNNQIKKGSIVLTRDGREHTVRNIDGRFIYFTDGAVFGINHPDILEVKNIKRKKENKSDTEEN